MGEKIDMAEAKKRVHRTVDKTIAVPAETAAAVIVEAAAPVIAATESVVTAASFKVADTLEAVTSPASDSDQIAPAAEAAPMIERIEEMATMTAPTTPAEGVEKAQAMFGDMTSRFKTAFEKSGKMSEEMVEFAKGNVEAVVASARVAAKAGEAISQEAAEYSKKHLESATALMKSFTTVKSPTELFQLQSDFAKTSFDSAVAEASKLSESLMKLAGEIAQPLSSRYAVAAEKFKANAI